jgi:UDP:flavonoid glycosyltransferase YjiC (YdhE family)
VKFVLAVHGTRGDVEPCAAVGLELLRRGHDVRMAVPENLLGFAETLGLTAVAYGPDSQAQLEEDIFLHKWWKAGNLFQVATEYITRGWAEMSTTLASVSKDADLILHGQTYLGLAANVAEHYNIPLAAMHHFPHRPNGYLVPFVPSPLVRTTMTIGESIYWRITKGAEDAQRRELGLPTTKVSSVRRIADRGSLEIQAYDEIFFPGLATEWGARRPFVGVLTLQLPTDSDDEVASWVAAGTPPIYFGFGSMPVGSPAETIRMIAEACAELGERALICAAVSEFDDTPKYDHVKVVGEVNHAAIFPACRAVVHHGGAGTTSAGMRAGVPTLVLWIGAEQPIWAIQVKQLKVGLARRFSRINRKSLAQELRKVLSPEFVVRAREVATQMTKPAASVTKTADLLEAAARRAPGTVGSPRGG